MATASLTPPQLPQMNADGVINQQDLTEDNGVQIVVQESLNAAKGDYLTLYWNGMQAGLLYIDQDDPSEQFPWSTTIPSALSPDGSYPVWYTRLDTAGNLIASSIVTAVVRRSDIGTLPAPVFTEADSLNTITDAEIEDGSTIINVPAYTNIASGDMVWIYYVGADSQGNTIPESVVTLTHTVTSSESATGFDVSIEKPYVTAINIGSATAWYVVQPISGDTAESSDSTTVLIDLTQESLPPPTFSEGNDGWIDYTEASDGTPVDVPAYTGIAAGDVVTVNWQGYVNSTPLSETAYSTTHTIVSAEVANGFTIIVPSVDIQPIGIGTGQAWYQVVFASTGDSGTSAAATINIDTTHTQLLPAPVFPEAIDDGIIDETEYADGTPIQVAYTEMAVGDGVTLYWQGYEEDDLTPVAGTAWSAIHLITSTDVTAGYFELTIPADFITPIGDGYATGKYTVAWAAGGTSSSETSQVKIMTTATSQLYLNAATGAPYRDDTSAAVVPYNTLTVSGPAGANVEISLSNDAYFNETGQPLWQGNLDQDGSYILHVYSLSSGLTSISAFVTTDPSITATASMTFGTYTVGAGSLTGYAVSTGVAANGQSSAAIYIRAIVSEDITTARVSLTSGTASMTGYPLSVATIPLYSDGSGSVYLTDTTAEIVDFTLNLPEAAGSVVTDSIDFITFPAV